MLHEQGVANVPQDGPAAGIKPAFFGELAGEGLDDLEHASDFTLVAGENDAFRQRIGDHDQMLRCDCFQKQRTARQNLVVLIGRLLDE